MVNLLFPGVMEKSLNREMILKALSEIKTDSVYFIVNLKSELHFYQDLGTCYLREDVVKGIYTDEQLELDKCVPLDDDIFDYMNPYVIEIINQQRRFEQRYDYQVSGAWEDHYTIFMHNLFFWNSFLERKQITHVFFTRIPHEGYDSVIYHLCKKKNIPVMMAFASLIPNRDYALTDYMKSDEEIGNEFEKLKEQYKDAAADEIHLEGNTREEFEKWTSLDPAKMKPAYMKGNKLRRTFRARYGETNLIRVWRGILGEEYEKYGMGAGFLGASVLKIPKLISVIPTTYKQWRYARPYWKETKRVNAFYEEVSEMPKPGEKYIYFALHYQPEATSNPLGGGAYTDQMIPLQILCRSLPKDTYVYVKAHPAQLAFFCGISYYQDMLRIPQVRLIRMECNTYDLIRNAFAVASLTGTACWESQFYGVPALLFGYSYKNASPLAYHVRTPEECRQAILDIENGKKKTTLKELKLYTKAAHNLSYPVSERAAVFPELIIKLVGQSE